MWLVSSVEVDGESNTAIMNGYSSLQRCILGCIFTRIDFFLVGLNITKYLDRSNETTGTKYFVRGVNLHKGIMQKIV